MLCICLVIASEASFLVCSMRGFFIYIYIYIYICLYISGRTSCRKCSKCFYVYLNIRPVRYSARIASVANARRQQLRTARQLRTAQSPKERDARLQQLRPAREHCNAMYTLLYYGLSLYFKICSLSFRV